MQFRITGNLVDIVNRSIYPVSIDIENGRISQVGKIDREVTGFILPGFVDAHVHIESSLVVPSEFARMAVIHGTIATVSDPHEIANVCGIAGVEYMLDNASGVPFYFNFGAPSCVPATHFETSGADLEADALRPLLEKPEIKYLAEMMNFPGVIHRDPMVMEKINLAHRLNKKVDGHAPGLRGDDARKYFEAGITTDHECFTLEEALDKLTLGIHVLIREGSAARNFEALIPALAHHPELIMFCSDDKHPDSLELGHINQLVSRAVKSGYDLFDTLKSACINPVLHYGLDHGQLNPGDYADLIIVEDLQDFKVTKTYIRGQLVAENGKSYIPSRPINHINQFNIGPIQKQAIIDELPDMVSVIECLDGQLITNHLRLPASSCIHENDILKVVVLNRYNSAKPAIGRIKNFGLKKGALASTVAHDSHNIIAVGTNDEAITEVINTLISRKGGLAASADGNTKVLPLPIAGLMSDRDVWEVSAAYTELDMMAKDVLGSTLRSPFMSLSFMALPVIPHLKMTDLGLFDGDKFDFCK